MMRTDLGKKLGGQGFSTRDRTPNYVKTYGKKKFEPKVMLRIAMSRKGISSPVITSGRGMAIIGDSYVSQIAWVDNIYHSSTDTNLKEG